jgi:hypothetical protein
MIRLGYKLNDIIVLQAQFGAVVWVGGLVSL